MPGIKRPDGVVEYVKNYKDFTKKYARGGSKASDWGYYVYPRVEYHLQRIHFFLDSSFFALLERLGHLSILPAIIIFVLEVLGIIGGKG